MHSVVRRGRGGNKYDVLMHSVVRRERRGNKYDVHSVVTRRRTDAKHLREEANTMSRSYTTKRENRHAQKVQRVFKAYNKTKQGKFAFDDES